LGTLLNYFQINSGEKLGTEVNLAKAMFIQNGYNLTKNFIKAAEDYLNTKLVTVNFKSDGEHTKHIINQYVLVTTFDYLLITLMIHWPYNMNYSR